MQRRRSALPATIVLALAALSGCSSTSASHTVPTVPAPVGPPASFTTAPATDPAPIAAATPTEAVQRYVAAEAAGDVATSWALLSDAERTRVGSFAMWADEAEARLPVRSITDTSVDGSTVVTDTVLAARLDETGVVPGRARIEWRPARRGDGWSVSPSDTTVTPTLPGDGAARDAVTRWLDARRRGEVADQYAGTLLGQPTLAERITAAPTVDAPRALDTAPDPQVAVNAFGPDAARYVRAVPATAGVPLVVLVAPYGDEWQVVGVQSPR